MPTAEESHTEVAVVRPWTSGTAVEVDIEPPQLAVMADEAALGSVLVNLMRNAIEAMEHMPQRVLRLQGRLSEDGRAVLTVSDTGPGIRDDVVPKLFEPFVTTKPAGSGLGLGLVLCAQLVRAMNGGLRADNREGGGAYFVVDLPAASPHAHP